MTTRTSLAILGVALLLAVFPVRSAQACSRIAVRSVQNVSVLPLEGGAAPRNTKVWLIAGVADVGDFSLVDAQGVSVSLQRSTLPVSGEETVNLEILTPVSLLDPGTWTFSRGGVALSHFTVTVEVDQVAPPALTATVSTAEGAYFGAYSCGQPSLVTLSLGAEVELAMAAPEGQAWPLSTSLGVASGPSLMVASPPEGDQRLVVFHVDLAGNATPGEVVNARVPLKASGCSVGPLMPWSLLALALIRRRRSAVRVAHSR